MTKNYITDIYNRLVPCPSMWIYDNSACYLANEFIRLFNKDNKKWSKNLLMRMVKYTDYIYEDLIDNNLFTSTVEYGKEWYDSYKCLIYIPDIYRAIVVNTLKDGYIQDKEGKVFHKEYDKLAKQIIYYVYNRMKNKKDLTGKRGYEDKVDAELTFCSGIYL